MNRLFRLTRRGFRWLAIGAKSLVPESLSKKNKVMLLSNSKMIRPGPLLEHVDRGKSTFHDANGTSVGRSDKPLVLFDGRMSIRVRLNASAERLLSSEVMANTWSWRSFSTSAFRERGCIVERIDGFTYFGATEFLAERIVRFPEELTESYGPGLKSLGGLGRCHWLAWRIVIRLVEAAPAGKKRVRLLPLDAGKSPFGFARRLAIANGANVILERNLSIPACLVRTGSLNVIYIDDSIDREFWPFLVFHELAHLILDHQGVSSSFFLEGPESAPAQEFQELQADALASVLDHLMRGLAGIADAVGNPNLPDFTVLPATPVQYQRYRIEYEPQHSKLRASADACQ